MDWDHYRDLFPVTDRYAYFQHPAVTALPRPAREALLRFSREVMEHGCRNESGWVQRRERVRELAGRLMECDPKRIGFVRNTSHGLSVLAESIPWEPGDSVVVPRGEFPANVYPWMNQRRKGVELRWVPTREGGVYREQIRRVIDDSTRVLSLSSVQFSNGFRADLQSIGSLCRQRDIHFVVDGIQSLGWDRLPLNALPVDALVADAHKWLCGPEGIGVCYLSEPFQQTLEWAQVGWNSVQHPTRFDRVAFDLKREASVLEEGSPNNLGLAALEPVLRMFDEIGVQQIRERNLSQHRTASEALRNRGFNLAHTGWDPRHRSPILVLSHPNLTPEAILRHCRTQNIQLSLRGGRVRIGFHFYNNRTDRKKLLDALDELL